MAQGPIESLRARRGASARVVFRGAGPDALEVTRALPQVVHAETTECGQGEPPSGPPLALSVTFGKDADVGRATEQVVAALVARGLGVREVTACTASLEQVFGELTTAQTDAGHGVPNMGDFADLQAGASLAVRHAARLGTANGILIMSGHPLFSLVTEYGRRRA